MQDDGFKTTGQWGMAALLAFFPVFYNGAWGRDDFAWIW
jgi:hypothetical protein